MHGYLSWSLHKTNYKINFLAHTREGFFKLINNSISGATFGTFKLEEKRCYQNMLEKFMLKSLGITLAGLTHNKEDVYSYIKIACFMIKLSISSSTNHNFRSIIDFHKFITCHTLHIRRG